MRAAGVLVALGLCASAQADNHAWTAGKKVLASGQQMVVIANWSAIHDSSLFTTLWPAFLAQHKEAAEMLGKTKSTCGIEPMGAIDSVVLALQSLDASSDSAVFVVSLKGVTQKDVDSCITKLEKAETGKQVTITTDAGITTYTTAGDTLYMRWLDKSTLVFSASGKDNLVKMTKPGYAADKTVAPGVSGVKSNAALAVIYSGPLPIDQVAPGAKATLLYASTTLAKGNVGVDAHVVVDSAKNAADVASKLNTQLASVKGGGLPPTIESIVKSVVVKSSGSEIVVTANAPEKDVLGLLTMALGGSPATP